MLTMPALALAQPAPAKGAPATPPAKDAAASAKSAAPAVPAPPPEVKATVDAFKGNWKFDTTITATGIPGMEKPFAAKMNFNCKAIAGGNAVSCDAKQKSPMGPFDGTFIVAYDPYSKAVHFFAITSMFEVHDHVCKWKSELELTCNPLKGGSGPAGDEITEDLTITWTDKKNVTFKSTSKMTKGGATMVFEGKGKR